MKNEDIINRLSAYVTCLKCETSGNECDLNCITQYEAGNMGEIIDTLEIAIEILNRYQ